MMFEAWFKMKDSFMDFKDCFINYEIGGCLFKKSYTDGRVFERVDGYYFIPDSRIMLKAFDNDISKVDAVFLTLDSFIVKITVDADPSCNCLYLIDVMFKKDYPILNIKRIKHDPYDGVLIGRLGVKKEGKFKIEETDDPYFKNIFNIEIFHDEYF